MNIERPSVIMWGKHHRKKTTKVDSTGKPKKKTSPSLAKVRTDDGLGERLLSCKKLPSPPSSPRLRGSSSSVIVFPVSPRPLKRSPTLVSTTFWPQEQVKFWKSKVNEIRIPHRPHADNNTNRESPLKSIRELVGNTPDPEDGSQSSHVHRIKKLILEQMEDEEERAKHLHAHLTETHIALTIADAHDLLTNLSEFEASLKMHDMQLHDDVAEDDEAALEFLEEYSMSKSTTRRSSVVTALKEEESASLSENDAAEEETVSLMAPEEAHKRKLSKRGSWKDGTMLSAKALDEVKTFLDHIGEWDFDVLGLSEVAGSETFAMVGMSVMERLPLFELTIDVGVLRKYLDHVGMKYVEANPYHNAFHGADVGHGTFNVMITRRWGSEMTTLEIFTLILAAFCHDVGHNGLSNAFLVNTSHDLAIRYHDRSPLENLHIAIAFETMRIAGCDVMGHSTKDEQKMFRKIMIETISGTDNALHFEHLTHLKDHLLKANQTDKKFSISNVDHRIFILQMIMHLMDLSNPSKPLKTYLRWCDLIMGEFHMLGDKEKEAGLPVGFINKRGTPLHDVQIGFVKFLVKPLFIEMNKINGVDIQDCLDNIEENTEYFEQIKKDVADAKAKQEKAERMAKTDFERAKEAAEIRAAGGGKKRPPLPTGIKKVPKAKGAPHGPRVDGHR